MGLVDEYQNLDIICNARIDTVMYDLPPERAGKCGRPKKYGERLSPKDFVLESPKTGDWMIGVHPVKILLYNIKRNKMCIGLFIKRRGGNVQSE